MSWVPLADALSPFFFTRSFEFCFCSMAEELKALQ